MELKQNTYVDEAEKIMRSLCAEKKVVTTSQIRNILALISDIYNQILNDSSGNLSDEIKGRIEYLRVRCAYEAGRSGEVKRFIEKSKLMEYLRQINGKRSNFLLFHHYVEALVAYHCFYTGNH